MVVPEMKAGRVALPVTLTGLALMHAAPAATWLPIVRRRLPALSGVGDPGHVALTFDDGPDPRSTPRFLDELRRLGCQATFFVLGEALARHPDLGRAIVAEGHELGVHGWRHINALIRWPGRVTEEIGLAADLVWSVTGERPLWYRPPYGVLTLESLVAVRREALRPVLWTAWGKDWTASATPASVLATLTSRPLGGATLLLHDCDRATDGDRWRSALGALPRLVDRCHAMGLRVGPLRDHGVAGSPDEEKRAGHESSLVR
ncbi:polysaccharide deacetylase family protein [Acrocarpospora catenulata]|uniref:polysaccharide deacetylase family protein n=1 Tax=Acrocarpospora catenulata TaxID=2836182 RepID=UPI00202399B2|nr:polysaccharide deacetylase family protein [Acrocarpospora catenulata]